MTISSPQATRVAVHQIISAENAPLEATGSNNLWVGSPGVFSTSSKGNLLHAFTTGEAYFKDLIGAFSQAREEICIAGWQVSWDALLAPKVRLYDQLLQAAKRGVRINVMPWNDTDPVQTYDDQTQIVLEYINAHPGVSGRPVRVVLAKSFQKKNGYFSHHQKQVVIDRKIAYVGGMDLCYGRFDTAAYDLQANLSGREVMNRYNGCVSQALHLDPASSMLVDPDLMSGPVDKYLSPSAMFGESAAKKEARKLGQGGWQVPYAQAGLADVSADSHGFDSDTPSYVTLDPNTQPRMPWQDVHSRVEGPAVHDLLLNFTRRWAAAGGCELPPLAARDLFPECGHVHVQVLRSAPASMRQAEAKAAGAMPNATEGTEDHIRQGMRKLIENSSNFIYIENQFFVSNFGEFADWAGPGNALSPAPQFIKDGASGIPDWKLYALRKLYKETVQGDIDAVPRNDICAALVARIQRAIFDAKRPAFHVYITLPVHPEGMLNDANVTTQVYWTMQTLVHGKRSLLNGIKRALKARELRDSGDKNFMRVIDDVHSTEYQSIPTTKCFDYVTLLNLRNWKKLTGSAGERYLTEQIYVHTKLMIVDDLFAIFGSANINDRSLTGEGDSEIAILVADGDAGKADTMGDGRKRLVRNFARNLRMDIWRKIFGITANIRPATHLKHAIESPGARSSWTMIQQQALKNATAYEAAFPWIARNWADKDKLTGNALPASIIPTWSPEQTNPGSGVQSGYPASSMPFDEKFWGAPHHDPAGVKGLAAIRGFFVALPIHWTEGENGHIRFPAKLLTENEPGRERLPDAPQDRVAASFTGVTADSDAES